MPDGPTTTSGTTAAPSRGAYSVSTTYSGPSAEESLSLTRSASRPPSRPPEARTLARPLAGAEHLTIAARGSSDNAATYGKYLFESLAGLVTALAAPSLVTRYRTPPSFARGAAIGISQSGAAPDVAAVLAEARAGRAPTVAITNRAGSLLARTGQGTFLLRCGPERSIAATKTYTATCVALPLLAANAAESRGRSALSLAGLTVCAVEAESVGTDA